VLCPTRHGHLARYQNFIKLAEQSRKSRTRGLRAALIRFLGDVLALRHDGFLKRAQAAAGVAQTDDGRSHATPRLFSRMVGCRFGGTRPIRLKHPAIRKRGRAAWCHVLPGGES